MTITDTMTTAEVCALTSSKPPTVRMWASRGHIERVPGHRGLYTRDSVERYIAKRKEKQ